MRLNNHFGVSSRLDTIKRIEIRTLKLLLGSVSDGALLISISNERIQVNRLMFSQINHFLKKTRKAHTKSKNVYVATGYKTDKHRSNTYTP